MAGSCKYGGDPSFSIKRSTFLEWRRSVYLVMKNSAQWSKFIISQLQKQRTLQRNVLRADLELT